MPLAIDVSNYSGPIAAAQARDLVAAGVRRVVVGTQYPAPPFPRGVAHEQIPALLEAGLQVHAYVYLWLAEDGGAQVEAALARLEPWRAHLGRLWLDVEDTTATMLTATQRLAAVRAAIDAARGMPVGIYTARWYWQGAMADTTACAALPLWVAQYDGRADPSFAPFGGWTAASMKQYAEDVTLAGVPKVDLNWYAAAARPLSEAEFGWAFAALYRGLAPGQLPLDIRWGEATRDAAGDEVHPLVIRGRSED